MDEKLLFLTWNNHGSTYKSMFNMLRQKNILTDITLACDGQQFSAHQLVLATCSDYFQSILSSVSRDGGNSCGGGGGHPIVYLRGVPAQEMHAMLEFMYTGQARLPQSEVKPLMETAKALRIKGLGVMPEEEDGQEQNETGNRDDGNTTTLRDNGNKNFQSQPLVKDDRSPPIVRKIEVIDSNQNRKRPLHVDMSRNEVINCKSSKNNFKHRDSSASSNLLSPKRRKASMSLQNSISVTASNNFSSPRSVRRDLSQQSQHGTSTHVSNTCKGFALTQTISDGDTLSELISLKSEPNFLQSGRENDMDEGPFCSDLESILDYTESRESKLYQDASKNKKNISKTIHHTNIRKNSSKSTNDASGCSLKALENSRPLSDKSLSSVNTVRTTHPLDDWRTNRGQAESDSGASFLHNGGIMSLEDEDASFIVPVGDEASLGCSQPLRGEGGTGEDECAVLLGSEARSSPNQSLLTDGGAEVGLTGASFEEEAKLYLEAFTRSAGLSRDSVKLPHEEPIVPAMLSVQEPPAPNVGVPEDPLNAINCPPELPFLPPGDAAEDAENRPFACPICRKSFSKAAILKRHHLAHFRPYTCQICQRSFTRREVLAEHLQEHNGTDMRLPCPVCAMTIKRKRNLQAHIKVKHPDYYRLRLASNLAIC